MIDEAKPQLWWICSCLIQKWVTPKLKQRPLMQELTDALVSKKTKPSNSGCYDYRPD